MANYLHSDGYGEVGRRYVEHNEERCYPRGRRKYRSLSFEGPVLVSYSTPIACYHKDATVLLMTNEFYSVTTRGHKQVANYHVHARTFVVPSIGAHNYGWSGRVTVEPDHQANLAHLWAQVTELQDKAIRLYQKDEFSWDLRDWPNTIRKGLNEMLAYQQLMGGDIAKVADFPTSTPEFIDRIHQARREKMTAFLDPKAVERRDRAKAKRLMKQALGLAS